MKLRKILAVILACTFVLSMAACGGNDNATDPTGTTPVQSLAVCLASEPDTLDPALNASVDGATMVAHLFSALAKWAQDDDGNLVIVPECAEELVEGVENEDGTITYTYTLKEGLMWSDGQPLTAADFVFSWNRAAAPATAADYCYMFDVIKGYKEVEAEEEGASLAVEAIDERTLQVTLYNKVNYWNELLAFPTYMPVREDVVANEAWATAPSTYVCNGPYTITAWEHDSVITLTKNENYYDAASVTMPEIKCYLSDDANNMLTNFKNGSWLLIDDVPTAEIPALKTQYPEEFVVAGQLGTYFVCWNVNETLLPADTTLTGAEKEAAQAEIRNALGLLLDRNYIVEAISQAGEMPASTFVGSGLTDADGTEYIQNAGSSEDYTGYFDVNAVEENFAAAVEVLKKYYAFDEATGMFTNAPSLTYIYNTNDAHQAIGEYIQGAFAGIGFTLNLENQEWNTFLNTRNAGDFSVARHGWVADYNDPITFLDMWITSSGNNDAQLGKGAHADFKGYSIDLTPFGYDVVVENGTWAETYDVIIAHVKSCGDIETRYALMHYAEDLLMSTGCINPVYYYTDIYMINSSVKGFYSNPLGYKYFMYTTVE
ncbi:MAG: peptide ABC transporter substrate-binding protein [Clostridia bacterium]|nr:peptide ABC transporter substrate-binding protein [Clostridia bacterium]